MRTIRLLSRSAVSFAAGENDDVVTNSRFGYLELIKRAEEVAVRCRCDVVAITVPPRLDIDPILAKWVLINHAVKAAITGTATVIDGDTLEVRGTRIRLHGIDAPESGQLLQRNSNDDQCG